MESTQKPEWDYVLCRKCPTRKSEYFVLGDDVGKPGVGVCPTCGTTIYHVICQKCGDQYEIGQDDSELNVGDNTWKCYCGERQPLPDGQLKIVDSLPPELEEEFKAEGAAMRAKAKKMLAMIVLAALIGFAITLLKLR